MRRLLQRWKQKRSRQRGAVAVEFALSLFFLVPLLLGTLDYGYYFWVGVNAMEAARAGARAAQHSGALAGCPVGPVAAATVAATNAVTGPAGPMRKVFSAANVTSYVSFPVNGCVAPPALMSNGVVAPVNPVWQIQVQVDFPPAIGFMTSWMPASAVSGMTRYRSSVIVSPP